MRNWTIFFRQYEKHLKSRWNLPSFSQWRQLHKALNQKERIILISLLILFFSSSAFLTFNFYFENTEIKPAFGGEYSEGIVGHPRFINPIYATANDADRDLVELIFSGLMKYDHNGEIIPDLIENYDIKDDGKIFELELKENIFWHDDQKFSADDVIFTIQTIQNSNYKSPLRANWLGVEIEKISKNKLRFKLKNPYNSFLERLTLKILPAHIWQNISPENFTLSDYNLNPIGTGPFQLKNLKQNGNNSVASLTLERFQNYFAQKPFLEKISFIFFDSKKDLINSANKGEIKGLTISPILSPKITKKELNEYAFSLPRYFSVFLNSEKSEFLKEIEIRQALNFGINRTEMLETILFSKGKAVFSPILPEIYGYKSPFTNYKYDIEKAQELLKKAGFEKQNGKLVKIIKENFTEFKTELKIGSKGNEVTALQTCLSKDVEVYPEAIITGYFGSATKSAVSKFQEKYYDEILKPYKLKSGTGTVGKSTRAKLNEICEEQNKGIIELKISLITVKDPLLEETADLLKKQWEKLGIQVEIKTFSISELERDFIKPRTYECLLFGEVLGAIPDLFPFWHSSQSKDPGLNLSEYKNKNADNLLEKIRITLDEQERQKMYEEFQDILLQDSPAVFLYSPDYLYFISSTIEGIPKINIVVDPSKRFVEIQDWYIKTKRTWK